MFRAGHAISRRACDRAFAARAAAGAPAPGAAGAAASWWEVPGFGGRQTKSMQGLTGGYILHDALVQQGVTVVFGYSGGAVLPVLDAFHPSNAPPGEAPPEDAEKKDSGGESRIARFFHHKGKDEEASKKAGEPSKDSTQEAAHEKKRHGFFHNLFHKKDKDEKEGKD